LILGQSSTTTRRTRTRPAATSGPTGNAAQPAQGPGAGAGGPGGQNPS
ncbi:9181_t:CDS:1, partial [Gigaspora rosea]